LNRFQVIARLAEYGKVREPFCAKTLAPIEHCVGKRKKAQRISRP
jgi:hypothetical protein